MKIQQKFIQSMLLLLLSIIIYTGCSPKVTDTALSLNGIGSTPVEAKAVVTGVKVITEANTEDADSEIWNIFDRDIVAGKSVDSKLTIRCTLSVKEKIRSIRIHGKGIELKTYIPGFIGRSEAKEFAVISGETPSWIEARGSIETGEIEFEIESNLTGSIINEIEIRAEKTLEKAAVTLDGALSSEELDKSLNSGTSHITEAKVYPDELVILPENIKDNPVAVSINLVSDPRIYSRAYLKYDGRDIKTPVNIERRVNGLSWSGSVNTGDQVEEGKWFGLSEEIDPSWLKKGENKIELSGAGKERVIRGLKLVLESDSGYNNTIRNKKESLFDCDVNTKIETGKEGYTADLELLNLSEIKSVLLYANESFKRKAVLGYSEGNLYNEKSIDINAEKGWNIVKLPEILNAEKLKITISNAEDKLSIGELKIETGVNRNRRKSPVLTVSYPRNGEYYETEAFVSGFTSSILNVSSADVEGKTALTAENDGAFKASVKRTESSTPGVEGSTQWGVKVTSYAGDTINKKQVELYSDLKNTQGSSTGSSGSSGSGSGSSGYDKYGGYTTIVTPESDKSILYKDVLIEIPKGAVTEPVEITIIPLNGSELAELDQGMVNVTYPAAGYRFLFNGKKHGSFKKALRITFGYSKRLFLKDQKDKDVNMYYYDETAKLWKMLNRVNVASVSSAQKISAPVITDEKVTAETTHFTDFINATLAVPEHPDPLSYNPNSLKDIKAGDPTSGVNLVEVGSGGNNGDASLTYKIEIPQGRRGMAPQLAIRYNSSGGNGWLGVGWDLSVQSITVDTKWGVGNGTKTYLLDGQPIINKAGTTNEYIQRIEGSFRRIRRIGDYFEVTDKSGLRHIYGRSAESRLFNGVNTYQWFLESSIDTNGNTINYKYIKESAFLYNVEATSIRLSEINYTGRDGGEQGVYKVKFDSTSDRNDGSLSLRAGFPVGMVHLLREIHVLYQGTEIRKYVLSYKMGPFEKSLLDKIEQYEGGSVFNEHSFTYFNEVESGGVYNGFAPAVDWNNAVPMGLSPGIVFSPGNAYLGSSEGDNVNSNISVGVSIFNTTKSMMHFGGQGGFAVTNTEISQVFMDIDGDGLPDQVYKNNGSVVINKNNGSGFISGYNITGLPPNALTGLPLLGADANLNLSCGFNFFFGPFSLSLGGSVGFALTPIYFSDIDGDGRPDFVYYGSVFFNNLDGSGNAVYTSTSDSKYYKNPGTSVPAQTQTEKRPAETDVLKYYYKDDPIRMWKAPFAGKVEITGSVQLINTPPSTYQTTDGVRVSIQHNSNNTPNPPKLIWSTVISAGDILSPKEPFVMDEGLPVPITVNVSAGDRIYFRVHSIDDGAYDAVKWDQQIKYINLNPGESQSLDENSKEVFNYSASDDFNVSGTDTAFVFPLNADAYIKGVLRKTAITTDDIDVIIYKNGIELTKAKISAIQTGEINVFGSLNLSLLTNDKIECVMRSDTPIDWTKISWFPVFQVTWFEGMTEPKQAEAMKLNLPVNVKIFPISDLRPNLGWIAPKSGSSRITFKYKILRPDLRSNGADIKVDPENIEIALAVKKANGEIIKKVTGIIPKESQFIVGGNDEVSIDAVVDLVEGEKYFFIAATNIDLNNPSGNVMDVDYNINHYGTVGAQVRYDQDMEYLGFLGDYFWKVSYEPLPYFYGQRVSVSLDGREPFAGGFRNWYYGRWRAEGTSENVELNEANIHMVNVDTGNLPKPPDPAGDGKPTAEDIAKGDAITDQIKTFSFMAPYKKEKKKKVAKLDTNGDELKDVNGDTIYEEGKTVTVYDSNNNIVYEERWVGHDTDCYIDSDIMCSTRVGKKYLPPATEGQEPPSGGGGSGGSIIKFSTSVNPSFDVMGLNPLSYGSSNTWVDSFDLNGDRMPDIVSGPSVTYTDQQGNYSSSGGTGSASIRENSNINVTPKLSMLTSPVQTIIEVSGNGEVKSATDPQPVGATLTGGYGEVTTVRDFVDINGDGLSDLVSGPNAVMNYGTGFGPYTASELSLKPVRINRTYNTSAGLTFAFDRSGFSGGITEGISQASSELEYMDINGDGLPDIVERNVAMSTLRALVQRTPPVVKDILNAVVNGVVTIFNISDSPAMIVRFNTGRGFTKKPYTWNGSSYAISMQETHNLGGSFAFDIPITITVMGVPIVSIHINPSVGYSKSSSKTTALIQDINGDGLADHIYAGNNKIEAHLNQTGKTNLLKEVKRPIGAGSKINFEYKREGNTQKMPQSRWVVSKVTTTELMTSQKYETSYTYKDGVYDKNERDFCGFSEVTETKGITKPIKTVRKYETDYFKKGLITDSLTTDGAGSPYFSEKYEYVQNDMQANTDLRFASKFTYLRKKTTNYFEGSATEGKSSAEEYSYDNDGKYPTYGNVTAFTDYGNNEGDFISARIEYMYMPGKYIMSLPSLISVSSNGKEYRRRAGSYDSNGNMREIRTYLDGGETSSVRMEYDNYGNMTSFVSPPNQRSEKYALYYEYDSETRSRIAKVSDSFGLSSQTAYEPFYGHPLSTTDINGNTTSYTYDSFGRLSKVYGPYESGGDSPSIEVVYTGLNANPTGAVVYNRPGHGGIGTIITATYADPLKRILQVRKSSEINGSVAMTVSGRIVYDEHGRVTEEHQPTASGGNEYSPAPYKNPTVNTYDSMGRKIQIDFPDSTFVKYNFTIEANRFKTVSKDQNGYDTTTYRDIDGNITQINDALGNMTRYSYNPMKEIISVRDAGGNETKITYDMAGRRRMIDNPDSGRTDYSYDLAGNMIRKITPNLRIAGKAINYSYKSNRLIEIAYPDMASVTYTYGMPGAGYNGAGRIVKASNGTMTEEFQYGKLGETTKSTKSITTSDGVAKNYITAYEFDNFGRMTKLVYPDGEVLNYAYDRGGLLKSATGSLNGKSETYVAGIEYDEYGQRTKFKAGNGTETTYEYHPQNRRLMKLRTSKGAEIFQNLEYVYDNVGNITDKTNTNFTTTDGEKRTVKHTYGYDKLYRLTTADGTFNKEKFFTTKRLNHYSNQLEYNEIGNILHKGQLNEATYEDTGKKEVIAGKTYDYVYEYGTIKQPHAVLKAGTRTMSYDDNGNMLTMADTQTSLTRAIVWDSENRIKNTTDNGVKTEYKYDAKGDRIIKKGSLGEVVYVNNNYTVRNNELESKHIFAGNTRVASKMKSAAADYGTYYFHADHLGSSNVITNKTGNFHEHVEYMPFGETWVEVKTSTDVDLPYRFTGKELDAESGLYYFGARYYDPKLSRWTAADPPIARGDYLPKPGDFDTDHNYFYYSAHDATAKLKGHGGVFNSINLDAYHYAGQNPVKFVDPDGNEVYFVNQSLLNGNKNSEQPLSHRFVATTGKDGKVNQVSTWLKEGSPSLKWLSQNVKWHGTALNSNDDNEKGLNRIAVNAANDSIKSGKMMMKMTNDDGLDAYIGKATILLSQEGSPSNHKWKPLNNCYDESKALLGTALQIYKKETGNEYKGLTDAGKLNNTKLDNKTFESLYNNKFGKK